MWGLVEDAQEYLTKRFGAADLFASGVDTEALLVTAYNDIVNCGKYTFTTYASGEDIPAALIAAQAEQALFLYANSLDMDQRAALILQGVTVAGIVQETFDTKVRGEIIIAPRATGFLREYLTFGKGFYF